MNDTLTGRILTLKIPEKYGFVRAAGVDYFFHRSGLEQTTLAFEDLTVGMTVEFTPIDGEKGLRAIEARVVGQST